MSFKLGKLYKIKFEDHTMSDEVEELMIVEVCGWVRKSTKSTVSVTTWNTITTVEETKKANDAIYNIARKLILSSVEVK